MVFRQALNLTHRDEPAVQFCGHPEGLRVRCANACGAVEWSAPGDFRDLDLLVPWALLADCEGNKAESVRLERQGSAEDARRRYVWMVLGKEGVIERSEGANCIASPVAASMTRSQPPTTTNTETPVTPTPAQPSARKNNRPSEINEASRNHADANK